MVDISVFPVFFTAIFFLVISPGPDLVLISTYSSTKGLKPGLMISLGIFLAGLLQTTMVAFGLGHLMQTIPVFAYAIKIAGALYLGYLGIKMLIIWYSNQQKPKFQKETKLVNNISLISKGLLNNLLNPKALIFFSLFLPQFTTGTSSIAMQIIILGGLLSCFALIVNIAVSFIFSTFGNVVGNKLNVGRHIDGFLGVIFLGLAARLATTK